SVVKIQKLIEENNGPHYPIKSLRCLIHEADLYQYTAAKKPLLDERKLGLRHAWTQARLHWGLDDWKNVVFSDESSFSLYSKTRTLIWQNRGQAAKYEPRNLAPKVQQYGGTIMI
ncbi:uncharacterized protein EV422DRAFT_480019, partial [Fimicolochytrium jonesii]|uniref:uncharacterized protein n=1 Tax=Fimicolochytrium jonesii TaxID=1396493 RepID=UPI0022FECDE6